MVNQIYITELRCVIHQPSCKTSESFLSLQFFYKIINIATSKNKVVIMYFNKHVCMSWSIFFNIPKYHNQMKTNIYDSC